MGTKWTAERHEKMRAVFAARKKRRAGRKPTTRSPSRAGATPLGKEISECFEARDLVRRIGWDLVRTLAARVS